MRRGTHRFSWRTAVAAWLVCTVLTLPVLAAGPAQHTTQRSVENFDLTIPSCSGEQVHVFGPIDIDTQTTINSTGTTTSMHFTPHLTAIGLTSGLEYVAVGPAQITTHTSASGASVTSFTNVTILVAPGAAPNLELIEVGHVTVNANGDTTVSFDNFRGGCRG